MAIARLTDRLPPYRALIAVQPASVEWSEEPTPQVEAAIARVCEIVQDLVAGGCHEVAGGAAMSKPDEIGIKVATPAAEPTGNALAILHEVADAMERLVRDGETALIDLRGLPLTPSDFELLWGSAGRE